jgi:hypothetical protein
VRAKGFPPAKQAALLRPPGISYLGEGLLFLGGLIILLHAPGSTERLAWRCKGPVSCSVRLQALLEELLSSSVLRQTQPTWRLARLPVPQPSGVSYLAVRCPSRRGIWQIVHLLSRLTLLFCLPASTQLASRGLHQGAEQRPFSPERAPELGARL